MTGLVYYTMANLSRKKGVSLVALRQLLATHAVGPKKWYCMTTQLDEMLRQKYPKSARAAIQSVVDDYTSKAKADFNIYQDIFRARYEQKLRKGATNFEWHLAVGHDFTSFMPMYAYNFVPMEDTVENCTAAYMIGLYIIICEMAFFRTMTNIMAEYNARDIIDKYQDVAQPGDRMVKDQFGTLVHDVELGSPLFFDMAGALNVYIRNSLIPKGASLGIPVSMTGTDKQFFTIQVNSNYKVADTALFAKLFQLINKIIQ